MFYGFPEDHVVDNPSVGKQNVEVNQVRDLWGHETRGNHTMKQPSSRWHLTIGGRDVRFLHLRPEKGKTQVQFEGD